MLSLIYFAPAISPCCQPIVQWAIACRAIFLEKRSNVVHFFWKGHSSFWKAGSLSWLMQFSWIPSTSVKRSKPEGTRHSGVKLHGCYTCKPLLHRGTEGVGSGLPDSLSTTLIFMGSRLVTSFLLLGFTSSCRNLPGSPLRWGDLRRFELTCWFWLHGASPRKRDSALLCPHHFQRRLLMTTTPSGAPFQTACTTSMCCQWDGIPPVPL